MNDDAITVTSATQTEDEVRASFGQPAADPPPAPVAAPASAAPDAAALDQEADGPKPDAEVSEAARTLRRSRADQRKAKIQGEINDLTRTREHERSELERERRERAAAAPPKPASAPAAVAPAPAAADAAPKFAFPDFDTWQAAGHPDDDYDAYTDARSDARDAWREGVKKATAAHEEKTRLETETQRADATRVEQFIAHEATYEAAHADYREVLKRVAIPMMADPATGKAVEAPIVRPFKDLLFRTGDKAPQILYFLGNNPADAERLFASTNPASLIEHFTEIKLKATQALSPAAAPAAGLTLVPPRPSKPVTDAPAPLEAVPGGAHHTPSLQQLAEDSEDADAYIARRKQQNATG